MRVWFGHLFVRPDVHSGGKIRPGPDGFHAPAVTTRESSPGRRLRPRDELFTILTRRANATCASPDFAPDGSPSEPVAMSFSSPPDSARVACCKPGSSPSSSCVGRGHRHHRRRPSSSRPGGRRPERLFGYTADEMVGRSLLDLVPPEHHTQRVEWSSGCGAGSGSRRSRRARALCKDGSTVPVSVGLRPSWGTTAPSPPWPPFTPT